MTKKLVLSVSGGGALGVGPLQFMKRLEKDLGTELYNVCEGYAGTSTGSIIVSGLWNKMTAEKLLDLYKKNLSNIFKAREINLLDALFNKKSKKSFTANDILLLVQPNYYRYDNTGLKKLLDKNFPHKMNKYSKPIFIPTTFMNGKSVEKVWDNDDKDVDQSFAVLTSCSAPTYFDVVKDSEGNEFCDGGLWANDPIMVLESGIIRCSKTAKYKKTFADGFKILSFNTGMLRPNKGPSTKNVIGWFSYIVDDWVACTGNSNLFEARANIGEENVFRCEPKVAKSYDMDNLKITNDIIKIWDEYYDSYDEEEANKKKGKKTVGQKACDFIKSTME